MDTTLHTPDTDLHDIEQPEQTPRQIELNLVVDEPEVLSELIKFPEGPQRNRYARLALRLGRGLLETARSVAGRQVVQQRPGLEPALRRAGAERQSGQQQ